MSNSSANDSPQSLSPTSSKEHSPTAAGSQEFLHNSRDILNQIFKARMAKPHSIDNSETISARDSSRSKAILTSFLGSKIIPKLSPRDGDHSLLELKSPPRSEAVRVEDYYPSEDYVVDNIWSKLRDCAMGEGELLPEDAAEVLVLLSSLINTDVLKSHEEVAESIFQSIDKEDLKTIDEEFLRYLTSNYAKLHSSQDEDDKKEVEQDSPQESSGSGTEDLALSEKLTFGNDVRRVLAKIKDWDFDVFALESLTPYPLVIVTEATLQQLNLTWKLELNISKLKRFLLEVQDAYISTNPYHNYIHATDCTQTMFHMLTQCQAINALGLGDLAILAMMLSAAIHDVAHPGVTGRYLISISAPLAIQYNDNSPLENLHLATAFNVLMKPANNFTDRLSKLQYRELRRLVIEMVLFTDNDRHFVLMEKVESLLSSGDINQLQGTKKAAPALAPHETCDDSKVLKRASSDIKLSQPTVVIPITKSGSDSRSLGSANKVPLARSTSIASRGRPTSMAFGNTSPREPVIRPLHTPPPPNSFVVEPRQLLLMQLALHAADVSNPVKPWNLHMKWYPRLMEEFYGQGDLERDMGMPITFAFDRHNPVPQPKFQLGFLKAIVSPMYRSFSKIPGLHIGHCLASLDANIKNWETLLASDETGERIKTPADVAAATASWPVGGAASAPVVEADLPIPPPSPLKK